MKTLAYYNGNIGPADELTVPVLDRALCFGDGCYEATLVVNGKAIDIEDHLDRFFNSMRMMKIDFDKSREELRAILEDMIKRFNVPSSILYWQCSRGTAPRSHAFPTGCTPNLMITIGEKGMPETKSPAALVTTEDIRYMYCNIKTLNLFPNVMASQKAKEAGAFETVFIRPDGFVTEGSHTNVFILKNGILKTHEDGCLVLPGITKKHVLIEARKLGVPVEEKAFTKEELFDADEVFVTSSTSFLKRASSIDGIPCHMSDEALFNKLNDAYTAHALE